MKVSISKSKNTTIYYLSRSVRVGNKTTTKTVEKIGTYDEIKKICGDMDPLDWAKEYAAKRTAEEKAHKQDIIMRYSSSALIDKNVRRSCNAGYLFLQDIHYSLGLDKICNSISEKYKFDYDLNDILSMLVYSRIIAPGSKLSSLENAQKFLEQPKCELHQVYRALEVIAKENDFFHARRAQGLFRTNSRIHRISLGMHQFLFTFFPKRFQLGRIGRIQVQLRNNRIISLQGFKYQNQLSVGVG